MNKTTFQSYAGFPALNIETGYTGGRLCIMAESENPGSDAVHVATCNNPRFARLFASAPRLLSALDHLQANPSSAANHRRAFDAMSEARGEVVKDSGLPPVGVSAQPGAFPALFVVADGVEVVSVDLVHDAGDLDWRKRKVSDASADAFSVSVVPLSLVLGAGALLTFVRRLSDGGHHAGEETALCAHAVLGSLGLLED